MTSKARQLAQPLVFLARLACGLSGLAPLSGESGHSSSNPAEQGIRIIAASQTEQVKWLEWGLGQFEGRSRTISVSISISISYLLGSTKNHAVDRKRKPDTRHNHNVNCPHISNQMRHLFLRHVHTTFSRPLENRKEVPQEKKKDRA